MNLRRTAALAAALVPAVVAGTQGSARAAAFSAARFGGEHGNVTTTNPTALYYNPAGIAFGGGPSGWSFFLDGTLALRQATWEHALAPTDTPEPPGSEGANTGKATLSNLLPGPYPGPMGAATLRLGRLALGLGFMAPFAGNAEWDKNLKFQGSTMFPGAVDGVQRWHGTNAKLTFVYLTPGIAYRWGRVAVGVTGNVIISSLASIQAKTPVGSGDPDVTREGRADLNVKGTHFSFGAGIMIEAIEDRLWLGAGYQAQPQLGAMKLQGILKTSASDGSFSPFPADFHQALPDSVRVGARFKATERLELRLSTEYTRWSVMQSQCISHRDTPCLVDTTGADATPGLTVLQNLRRKWKDTIGVRAGASLWVRPTVEIFAGTGFETAAIPDETLNPGLADANHIDGALGGRFQLSERLFLAASFTLVQFFDRDNTGKSTLADYVLPTKLPDGGGKYTQRIEIFNTNIEFKY